MNEITRIQAALRSHLPWYGARLRFLSLFLVALFRVEKVNLDKLSSVFANQAQGASNYKRLTIYSTSGLPDKHPFFRHYPAHWRANTPSLKD